MNENNQNRFATAIMVIASMVFILLMIGIVGIAYGLEGIQYLLPILGVVAGLAVMLFFVIVTMLVVAYIFNLANRNDRAAQESNDRADVAKFNALREGMRADREYDKDVRRLALPVARQLARPAPQSKAVEQDDFYQLPVYDDGNTIDYEGNS